MLEALFHVWSNVRGLHLAHPRESGDNHIVFALKTCAHALALRGAYRITKLSAVKAFRCLNIMHMGFSQAKEGLVPPMTPGDPLIRAIIYLQCIWTSYVSLASSHNLFAIFFVCVLRWDDPVD